MSQVMQMMIIHPAVLGDLSELARIGIGVNLWEYRADIFLHGLNDPCGCAHQILSSALSSTPRRMKRCRHRLLSRMPFRAGNPARGETEADPFGRIVAVRACSRFVAGRCRLSSRTRTAQGARGTEQEDCLTDFIRHT
jgi:hypothetical protein